MIHLRRPDGTLFLCESSRRITCEGRVGRSGAQPQVLDGAADGEVVEALPIVAGQTECAVQHIIEVAANTCAAPPRRLRRQILARLARIAPASPG